MIILSLLFLYSWSLHQSSTTSTIEDLIVPSHLPPLFQVTPQWASWTSAALTSTFTFEVIFLHVTILSVTGRHVGTPTNSGVLPVATNLFDPQYHKVNAGQSTWDPHNIWTHTFWHVSWISKADTLALLKKVRANFIIFWWSISAMQTFSQSHFILTLQGFSSHSTPSIRLSLRQFSEIMKFPSTPSWGCTVESSPAVCRYRKGTVFEKTSQTRWLLFDSFIHWRISGRSLEISSSCPLSFAARTTQAPREGRGKRRKRLRRWTVAALFWCFFGQS